MMTENITNFLFVNLHNSQKKCSNAFYGNDCKKNTVDFSCIKIYNIMRVYLVLKLV